MSGTPLCRRCLLEQADKKAYESIAQYVALIDEDKKADDALYKKRLGICSQCDCLNAGMCRKCGCYVELRAAYKSNYCPHENKLW